MLPKAVEKIVLDIAERLDERERKAFGDSPLYGNTKALAQEDPEEWIIGVLEQIRDRLPEVSATLHDTITRGAGKMVRRKQKERYGK